MSTITNILQNVWKRKDDFCCLCFNGLSEDPTHIEDEVFTSYNDSENYVRMSEILSTVFDYEILDYVSTFKYICTACTQAAVNSYAFIKTSQINSEQLTKAIHGLLSSVENTHESPFCNTLFIALNTEDFSCQQYYDQKKPTNSMAVARRRYNGLVNTLANPKLEIGIPKEEFTKDKPPKKLRRNCVVKIRTKDMMANEDYAVIKCKECFKQFSSKLKLRNHYIQMHAPKLCSKSFKCTECCKHFASTSCLQRHINKKHCTIICSECGKTFKNKSTFKIHEMTHYQRFVCADCGRVYKNKSTYKKHIELNVCYQTTRASPANAKFTCDYCNKKYTQKVSLRVHIQYEHGNYKYHECNVCNKKFWAQSRLKAHMVKHTKEKNFLCNLCNGKFVTKEALLYHTRIHTGEKPYQCPNCDARFLSASRRSEHVKRHHTNATLECDMCGSKFNSQNYLQKHKKGHFSSDTLISSHIDISDNVTPQKVNEADFKNLTQELKRMEDEEYKISNINENEVYQLQFCEGDGDYTIQISAI